LWRERRPKLMHPEMVKTGDLSAWSVPGFFRGR